jgi:hypothetical protein
MTLEQIIYDIKMILRATTDDTRISDAHLFRKILNYRTIFITQEYFQTGTINTSWLQRLGLKTLTPVNSADNPIIIDGTIKLGKFTMPAVIPIGTEQGVYALYEGQRQKQIYRTIWPVLMHMISAKDGRLNLFRYYCKIGNDTYVYRFIDQVEPILILDNPLDGYNFNTERIPINDLENGIEYYVMSGSLKEVGDDGITVHIKNTSFTCDSNSVYSGDAKIRLTEQVVAVAYNNEFPVDGATAQRIVLEILTKDFAIERQAVSDVVNDSADQAKILSPTSFAR